MDADDDHDDHGDQDMQFSHTRSQATATTLGRGVTQEEQASTAKRLSQSSEHIFNEVMAKCKEVYKVMEGDVAVTAALMETLNQAYLDAAGAKARKERLRAIHEDGGDADDLHLSANGTSKLRNAKRIKAHGTV
jgi:hypothetical protein